MHVISGAPPEPSAAAFAMKGSLTIEHAEAMERLKAELEAKTAECRRLAEEHDQIVSTLKNDVQILSNDLAAKEAVLLLQRDEHRSSTARLETQVRQLTERLREAEEGCLKRTAETSSDESIELMRLDKVRCPLFPLFSLFFNRASPE